MNKMEFEITCPRCGGDLDFVTRTVPSSARQGAVVRCATCRRDSIVTVELVLTFKPEDDECGSEAGYWRHLRRNEDACQACSDERNACERERRRVKRLANV